MARELVVVVTAPSLNAKINVSGVSSVAKLIMGVDGFKFLHYLVGRPDGQRSGLAWFYSQLKMFFLYPYFVFKNNVDLVHLNVALNPFSIIRDSVFLLISKIIGIRVFVHLHGGRYLDESCENFILRYLISSLLRHADGVGVLSALEVGLLRNNGYSSRDDVFVLRNCIDPKGMPVPLEKGTEKSLRLIFMGRFHESKGVLDIANAAKLLLDKGVDFKFFAYGAGPECDFFCNEMRSLLGDRFHFGGVVSGADKWSVLDNADVFLLPSRHGEGLPMAMLEAMAMGCCVVVTDMASISAVVKSGENGFLVERCSPEQIADAVSIVSQDRLRLADLGNAARTLVLSDFSYESYSFSIKSAYAKAMS